MKQVVPAQTLMGTCIIGVKAGRGIKQGPNERSALSLMKTSSLFALFSVLMGCLVPFVQPCGAAVDAAPYFDPSFTVGNSWSYTENGSDADSPAVTVARTQLVNATETYVSAYSGGMLNGREGFLAKNSSGYYLHREYKPNIYTEDYGYVTITGSFTPALKMCGASFEIGETISGSGSVAVSIAGLGTYGLDYSSTLSFVSFETITVPMGTFDTVKVEATVSITGSVEGSAVDLTTTSTTWIAPYIGTVKVEESISGQTNVRELKSTNIDFFSQGGEHVYYLPWAIEDNDHATGVALRNLNDTESAAAAVVFLDEDGVTVGTASKILPPDGQSAFLVSIQDGDQEGWIMVTSDQRLAGLCFVSARAHSNWAMADITLIPELATRLIVPHVAQNATWDTIIFVCNPNDVQIQVGLTFVEADGDALPVKYYTVAAFGSGQYSLADVLGAGTSYGNGSVIIQTAQGVAAFALYYNTVKTSGYSFAGISAVDPEDQ